MWTCSQTAMKFVAFCWIYFSFDWVWICSFNKIVPLTLCSRFMAFASSDFLWSFPFFGGYPLHLLCLSLAEFWDWTFSLVKKRHSSFHHVSQCVHRVPIDRTRSARHLYQPHIYIYIYIYFSCTLYWKNIHKLVTRKKMASWWLIQPYLYYTGMANYLLLEPYPNSQTRTRRETAWPSVIVTWL